MRHKLMKLGMKHKRIMAAFAGAAVISATMLTGMPAKAHAMSGSNEIHESSVRTGEHDKQRVGDPVRIVRNNAAAFGFDADRDRFSLLSSSGSKATVQVRSNGRTFKVDLVREGRSWTITTIRGIGDSTHPATYTPAKYFSGYTTLPATSQATGQVLYQNTGLNGWSWNEDTYPDDMSFGLVMHYPAKEEAKPIPDNVLDHIKTIDFGRQFVLYAHLGSVGDKGYGIAVERVVQQGSDIAVTLRTRSPEKGKDAAVSVFDTYITLDRSVLAYGNPTRIRIYDQYGSQLAAYTISVGI